MELKETDKERLRLLVMEELQENSDLFDMDAEIDSALTFDENKNIILEKIEHLKEREIDHDTAKEQEMLINLNKMNSRQNTTGFLRKVVKDIKVMVVYGGTGSGKTAFCFKVLQSFKKDVYIFNHPNKKLISNLGYKNLGSLSELSRITDSVIYFDEPQMYFDKYDKRTNDIFTQLCSMARQKELTLIFSTSDTRWVNRGLESYVSHWIVKDLDITLVKNGSAVKKIVKSVMPLAVDDLNLDIKEYVFYSKVNREFNGLKTFNKPIYYDDKFSKAWKYI